jgi:hypothetical protein
VDSHLHILWTDRVRAHGRRGLAIHINSTSYWPNPKKYRHLHDCCECLFYCHALAGTYWDFGFGGDPWAGLSGISGERADATKGSGTRGSW